MPIKPENKKLYPDNWKDISKYIRFERAENKCEVCGVDNYKHIFRGIWKGDSIYLDMDGYVYNASNSSLILHNSELIGVSLLSDKIIKIILTVAHLDHDPRNNDHSNLKAMCQKCHNNYDKFHRKETRRKSKEVDSLEVKLF